MACSPGKAPTLTGAVEQADTAATAPQAMTAKALLRNRTRLKARLARFVGELNAIVGIVGAPLRFCRASDPVAGRVDSLSRRPRRASP
jgi:hypothetical protein